MVLWNWSAHDLVKLERSGAVSSIMNGHLHGRLACGEGADSLLKSARDTLHRICDMAKKDA